MPYPEEKSSVNAVSVISNNQHIIKIMTISEFSEEVSNCSPSSELLDRNYNVLYVEICNVCMLKYAILCMLKIKL